MEYLVQLIWKACDKSNIKWDQISNQVCLPRESYMGTNN